MFNRQKGRKLVMCTAYDYPFGLMADEAGMDMVLVTYDMIGLFDKFVPKFVK
jgi:ketopantoate hydroxymethyltransferase